MDLLGLGVGRLKLNIRDLFEGSCNQSLVVDVLRASTKAPHFYHWLLYFNTSRWNDSGYFHHNSTTNDHWELSCFYKSRALYTLSETEWIYLFIILHNSHLFFLINVLASSNKKKDCTSGFRKAACWTSSLCFCIISIEEANKDIFCKWFPRAHISEYKINSAGHENRVI